jgi:CheY-like chemotaxis protein
MDMMMPVMDGWEATRTLRASRETKEIPILATTALFRSEDLKSCLDAGCVTASSSSPSMVGISSEKSENC